MWNRKEETSRDDKTRQDKTRQDKTRQDKTRRLSADELESLIEAAQGGHIPSEEQLQRMCRRFVRQVRQRYAVSTDISEDWVGQVWLILHRLIVEFDPSCGIDFFTYIASKLPFSIKTWIEQMQKEMERERVISEFSSTVGEEEPEVDRGETVLAQGHLEWMGLVGETSVEDAVILRVEFARVLATLPPRRRQVFLRVHAGESYKEIAESLGISEALCRQEVHRARVALQRALEEIDGEQCHESGL